MSEGRVKLSVLLLCLAPGGGFLLLLFGLPLVRVLIGSFTDASGAFPTLSTWQRLLTTPVYLDGLWYSLWLGLAPTIVSLLISLPLSALMQANETTQKLFGALYRIPLVVPGIVAGFIVLVLLDRGGTVSRLLAPFGLSLPRLVRDPWGLGAIIASSWKNIPFMTLIIAGSMAAINKDVLLAARTLGASRLTILWRIQLPLAKPGVTAAVLLTFIGSLGSFVIPSLLGPSYPLPLSVHMYMEGFQKGNWPMVYAMGTLLSVCAIGVLLAYYAVIGRIGRTPGGGRQRGGTA
jgi:putative spermidine/putrescine transport system permease protein